MSRGSRYGALGEPGFLASARASEGVFPDTATARRWLIERRRAQHCRVTRIAFAELRGWRFQSGSGDLVHESGRFFRLQGIRAKSDFPSAIEVQQPIINQPEVGVLGILAKRFEGVLHFLLQAKMEPGNVDLVQLSPTVQATRSNYTRVHGGARPRYLEFFLQRTSGRVLVDQLQSEQGLFFFRKRNRNIIVETDADVPVHDDYCWLTLGQMKQLLKEPHTVNMDTRTVVAAIPLVSTDAETEAAGWRPRYDASTFDEAVLASTLAKTGCQSMDAVLSWLTGIRSSAEVDCQPCPLNAIEGWALDEQELRRTDGRYFKVIGVSVLADTREVPCWTQPMVQPVETGVAAFVTKRIDGLLHFLVQARMEIGVWNLIELGPTVQYLRGAPGTGDEPAPFLLREVLDGTAGNTRHRSTQSEEGGRFFQYVTENIVVELDEHMKVPAPSNYTWMTLGQLNTLIQYGNHVNIEARSVLACLDVEPSSACIS